MDLENSPSGIKNIMKFKEIFERIKLFLKNLTPKQKKYIVIGAVLGFILINSMLNGRISQWLSHLPRRVVQLFIPYGKIKWLDVFLIHKIRKFTHFVEYMVFGIIVSKYYLFKKRNVYRLINSIYIVLSIALVDETIQLISNRQSLVSDIWLDLFGGVVGVLVYLAIKYYKHQKAKEKKL